MVLNLSGILPPVTSSFSSIVLKTEYESCSLKILTCTIRALGDLSRIGNYAKIASEATRVERTTMALLKSSAGLIRVIAENKPSPNSERRACADTSVAEALPTRAMRATNTNQFKRFLRSCILPHLQPFPMQHSVVVMDRASTHFRPDVIELIERHGASVFPTAPYCPLDNPTEYLNSWVKSWLKRNEMLVERIGPQLAMDTQPENHRNRQFLWIISYVRVMIKSERGMKKLA